MGIRENVKVLDSVKILDGFKSVLEQFSQQFEIIKMGASNRNKSIDEDRKRFDDNLSNMIKFIEDDYREQVSRANSIESDKLIEYNRSQLEIENSISRLNDDYDRRIDDVSVAAEAEVNAIDSTIQLLGSAIQNLEDFFNLRHPLANKKSGGGFSFWENLSSILGIPRDKKIYWYKKYQFVFGETEVEYLHDAYIRIGETVNNYLYNSFQKNGVIYEDEIIRVVQMLFQEVQAANEFDTKRRFKMPEEQRQHIENAVYLFVQMNCACVKFKEQRDNVVNKIEVQSQEIIKKLQIEKENRTKEIARKKTKYTSDIQDELNKIKDRYNQAVNEYHKKEEEYSADIDKAKQNSSKKAQEERNTAVVELKEALSVYFDKCLDGVTLGLDSSPISIKEFVALGSNFNTRIDGIPYKTPDDYRTYICAGAIRFEYSRIPEFRCHSQLLNATRDLLQQYFKGVSGSLFALDDNGISIPYVIDFTFFKGLCFDYPLDKYDFAKRACQSLMFHMLTDTKASSIYYTMVDSKLPSGFFSIFNSFKGVDARTDAILNSNKIFNTELDISAIMRKQCESLTTASASFEFNSIVECNRHMEARKRPINVIFITDSSNDAMLHNAYNDIKTLVSGTKLGYSCVFMRSSNSENAGIGLADLDFHGTILEYIDGYKYHVQGTNYSIEFLQLPSSDIIAWAGNNVSDCFKNSTYDAIDFSKKSRATSKIEEAYDGISVDGCMLDENNAPVSYELNDIYLNGLIMGGPGFGKTRFIHVIIAGIMKKYSPDSVRIHVLDYKQNSLGASIYSKMKLPHIGVISNITNRVLGLNFLKYIDEQMSERTGVFNLANANIDKYSAYMPWCSKQKTRGNDVKAFPREIVIIDEVQELIGKDDEISRECNEIIKRILRLGRASGIHLIIATQWLLNLESSLDVELINEGIQNMVLFHSQKGYGKLDISSAAMSSVIEKGQALYKLGGIENVVNTALIDGDSETQYLQKIENTYKLSNTECNTILLRKRINDGVTSELVRFYGGEDIDFSNLPIIIGESIDFIDAFVLKPKGNNLIKFLMLSQEQVSKSSVSATIILCLLAKILKSQPRQRVCIIYADFANDCEIVYDTIANALPEESSEIFHYFDSFTAIDGIQNQLHILKDTNTDIYLFVNDIAEGMKNPAINRLFKIINDEVKVNLFVFGDSAEQLSAFETDSHSNRADFCRAVYLGNDTDYAYMVGKSVQLEAKRGNVILCRGFDSRTHEVVPFDYSDNKQWVKNFIKKLFIG